MADRKAGRSERRHGVDRRRGTPPPELPPQRPSTLDSGLVGIGIGLAAAGIGGLIGLAAERVAVAGRVRVGQGAEPAAREGDVPYGTLRGEPRIVVSDGVPLHVEIDEAPGGGSELTVVLSHGYALSLDSWHYQRLALRGRYRLVLWDQRGHGRSGTGPKGSSTIDQVGRDLGAVIDQVAPEGPLVLLGHSMGGMTVMSLAADRPQLFAERVAGVGLVSTSAGGESGVDLGVGALSRLAVRAAPPAARLVTRVPGGLVNRGRRLGSDLESLLVRRYSFASPVSPALVAFAARMISSTRVDVISDFLPTFGTHDKRAALATLADLEVLLVVGDHDLLTPLASTEQMAEVLPHAEPVVVADAGHLVLLEHPDLVTGPIEDLLHRADDAYHARDARGRRRAWVRRTVTPVRQRWPRHRPSGHQGGTGEPA